MSRRTKLVGFSLVGFSIASLAAIGVAVYLYLTGVRDAVRSHYDVALAYFVLELHLRTDDCRWPTSWDDLQQTISQDYSDDFSYLRDRVEIEWAVEPCAALALGPARPLLIYMPDRPETSLQFSEYLYAFIAQECCGEDHP